MRRWQCIVVVISLCALAGCRKKIDQGTGIHVSGKVYDNIKQKALANAKLYLYGAKNTFYGVYYTLGPFDSVVTDNAGNFVLQYDAEGQSVDYGLSLGNTLENQLGFNYSTNYVMDAATPMYKFNYATNLNNVVVPGRELNYMKIHLKVDANPFDSFQVRNWSTGLPYLIVGQQIDSFLLIRHLPNDQNIIEYYTEALRDTAGLAQLNAGLSVPRYSVRRALRDTIVPNLDDTIFLSKTISSSLSMPRGQ